MPRDARWAPASSGEAMKRCLSVSTASFSTALIAMAVIPLTGAVAATSPARYGAPRPGQCYNVSGKTAWAANSIRSRTVVCSKKHDLWVAAVTDVPKRVINGQHGSTMNARTAAYYYRTCIPALAKYLGSVGPGLAKSAYEPFWFLPTKAQRAKGGHWLSCNIGIVAGKNRVVTTTARKPTKVTGKLPERLRLCGTAKFVQTNCAATHDYRASYAFAVHKAYTQTNAYEAAERACPAHVRSALWMYDAMPVAAKRFLLTCLSQTTT